MAAAGATFIALHQEIYEHYTSQVAQQQPVMYLLLPSEERTERVTLMLSNEGYNNSCSDKK